MGVLEIIAGVLEPVFNLLLHKIGMKNNGFIVRFEKSIYGNSKRRKTLMLKQLLNF